jgi:hypothetical protein
MKMLDETCVTTILTRYFPMARRAAIDNAAKDLMLLDLLVDDRLVVWEDSFSDRREPDLAHVFSPVLRNES